MSECQVSNCDREAHYVIRKGMIQLHVCDKCRDDLMALAGWELT